MGRGIGCLVALPPTSLPLTSSVLVLGSQGELFHSPSTRYLYCTRATALERGKLVENGAEGANRVPTGTSGSGLTETANDEGPQRRGRGREIVQVSSA